MSSLFGVLLWPLIAPMKALFLFYAAAANSFGWAVVLLGATMAVLSEPLRWLGRKTESRLAEKISVIKKQTAALDKNLTGEKRFWLMEKIYKKNRFHPIHNMLAGASFIFQLPFLIAAFLMLAGGVFPAESVFGFIKDLSLPDGALGEGFNILPALVLALSLAEAQFFYAKNPDAKRKFMLIPAVIFLLIYNLPSGLVLYWAALSATAAIISFCRRKINPAV
ncbi:MAG: YidC/Oxa1 family membrane protein insertase [Betaproteobacteria bacterium]|nr:YidC/Oxa1 family membrane protein insertase [Betaproteobacteria bacterium]